MNKQELENRLSKLASNMLLRTLSVNPEDYPKSTPKSVLEKINDRNELMRCYVNEINGIKDKLGELK